MGGGVCSNALRRARGRGAAIVGLLSLITLVTPGLGCRSRDGAEEARQTASTPPASSTPPTSSTRTAAPVLRPRIVVLGDSLSAGFGLPAPQAFPAVLQRKVDEAGYAYEVVNMGVSGDTSAGGLSRLDWALDGDVRLLVVALGGNDGLRGLPPDELAANLGAIVDRARARHIAVLLCGMESPPNFGVSYTSQFRDVYRRLARDKRVELLPFLLEGVAGNPSLNQADGIHPNEEGARRVADLVWARLRPMLDAMSS
jgi:acyl-CoA thioesterase-1